VLSPCAALTLVALPWRTPPGAQVRPHPAALWHTARFEKTCLQAELTIWPGLRCGTSSTCAWRPTLQSSTHTQHRTTRPLSAGRYHSFQADTRDTSIMRERDQISTPTRPRQAVRGVPAVLLSRRDWGRSGSRTEHTRDHRGDDHNTRSMSTNMAHTSRHDWRPEAGAQRAASKSGSRVKAAVRGVANRTRAQADHAHDPSRRSRDCLSPTTTCCALPGR